ncbi:AI-2E family transporter [Pontibacter akesuensis]|uniref:Predicted PurR-regulated permease PerM n=1 Tax=Pontibacter akesuensis TaxID=388950 RepID=A0A1I7G0P9_9BACT|nr:AI-2E family transporter [Pontibacter akesuensis]GHA59570.1 AI-2E family transporter [Pontibacter akesuensis]SFU41886.1 Predicted PurR-regulated permease PerM [Pontibacter akesuensis]
MGVKYRKIKRLTFILLFAILLVYVLVEAREFLYPIFIAILFSYLLYPIVSKLEEWGVPRILANLLTIIAGMATVVGVLVLLYQQLSNFLGDLPALQEQAFKNIDRLQFFLERRFGEFENTNKLWLRQQVAGAFQLSGTLIKNVLKATTDTLVKFGLMPVYVFLMLYYRNKFENFLYRQIPSFQHSKAQNILEEISQVTKRYMTGVVIVILILCVINSTGLLLIGLEYAILLGILSAFMNFIPYFGTLIGGAIPLLYVLMVQGSPQKALAVVLFFLLVQFTENNILTPNITGSKVNINPMFTILSIVVGGMIWGLPGMFVAVPFLGMFKIYCDYTDGLTAWSYLLGTEGTEEHAFTINKLKILFSRRKQG